MKKETKMAIMALLVVLAISDLVGLITCLKLGREDLAPIFFFVIIVLSYIGKLIALSECKPEDFDK